MTKIEWTHREGTTGVTWSPVTGCTKISEGCRSCYAERMSKRLAGRFGYPENDPFAVTTHFDKFDVPLKWKKPRTVFVCSMGDLFHFDVGYNVHQTLWDIMEQTPQHTYIVLTKRAESMLTTVDQLRVSHGILPNVWLGVTVENQQRADERIPFLLQTSAAVRFVSVEPMLGPIEFGIGSRGAWRDALWVDDPKSGERHLNWIICGAETGPGARTMQLSWAYSVMRQCKDAGVPFFFKSAGKNIFIPADLMVREWPVSREAPCPGN